MASAVKRARQALETAGFAVLTGAVRRMSRRRAMRVGSAVGRFAFDRLRLRREVAIANVRERLQPAADQDAVAIARGSYEVMARTFMDLVRGDRLSDQELWSLVSREETQALAEIHSWGRGGFLVSGHFGNWELMVLAIRRLGVPVAAMAGDQSNQVVDRALRRLRERAGITPLSARSGLRDALRFVRKGGFVATLMDQDARHKGVFAEFLGQPASTHTGVLSMVLRTGAPLVPGVLVEHGDRYDFRLGPLWEADPDRTNDENLRHGAVHYNEWLEKEVRRAPESYFWAHRRWKTRPRADDVIAGADRG